MCGLAVVAFPVSTYLAGVVDGHSLGGIAFGALLVAITGVLVLMTSFFLEGPLDRLLALVAFTWVVVALDLVTGSTLQLNTVFGYSPIVAGRFAGAGNIVFAVFGVTAILTGALIAYRFSGRRFAMPLVIVLFVVTVVIDGAPSFGSDVGGVLALVPALGLTLVLLTGRRPRLRTVVIAAVAGVVALALFLVIDLRQPADSQTHLARLYEDTRRQGRWSFGRHPSAEGDIESPRVHFDHLDLLRAPRTAGDDLSPTPPERTLAAVRRRLPEAEGRIDRRFDAGGHGIRRERLGHRHPRRDLVVPRSHGVASSPRHGSTNCGRTGTLQEGGSGVTRAVAFMAGASGLTGFVASLLAVRVALASAPRSLVSTNVNQREVPVVLGFGVLFGTIAGAFALMFSISVTNDPAIERVAATLVIVVVAVMFAAGLFDDLRGDEKARGFRGHMSSASVGALTGGLVKIVAGGIAGAIAAIPAEGLGHKTEVFLLVALTANLFNLLDRAPGRALKVAFLFFVPLMVFAPAGLAVGMSGLVGALVAVGPADLRERAMLGDAGANPIGAVVGLALAYSLDDPFRLLVLLVIGALNVMSERVSFSRVVDSTPWLKALDQIGRE